MFCAGNETAAAGLKWDCRDPVPGHNWAESNDIPAMSGVAPPMSGVALPQGLSYLSSLEVVKDGARGVGVHGLGLAVVTGALTRGKHRVQTQEAGEQ